MAIDSSNYNILWDWNGKRENRLKLKLKLNHHPKQNDRLTVLYYSGSASCDNRDSSTTTHSQEGIITSRVAMWDIDTTPPSSQANIIGESNIVRGSQQRSRAVIELLVR